MKRLLYLIILAISLNACDDDKYARVMKFQTIEITEIGVNSVEIAIEFLDIGDVPVSEFGLCWSMNLNPDISNQKITIGSHPEVLMHKQAITGLEPGNNYYVRAYAIVNQLPKYGDVLPFSTKSIELPSVQSFQPNNITSTSAELGGSVISDGNAQVTGRGVCYGISSNPTIRDQRTDGGMGTGDFSTIVSGLIPGLNYYVRAYAINSKGTAYGEEYTFTTPAV